MKHLKLFYPEIKINDLIEDTKEIKIPREYYYISDIHYEHLMKKITITELKTMMPFGLFGTLFIAGDLSDDVLTSKKFLKILREHNPFLKIYYVLGNHELWTIDKQKEKEFEKFCQELNICFIGLKNKIFFNGEEVSLKELKNKDKNELKELIISGIGFAAYNPTFSFEQGIYRNFLKNKEEEIKFTKSFLKLYNDVLSLYKDEKNVIVLTHFPVQDWNPNGYNLNWKYVNGHTHQNLIIKKEDFGLYSNNQIGYYSNTFDFKSFLLEMQKNIFKNKKDGFFEITRKEYLQFCSEYFGLSFHFKETDEKIIAFKKNDIYMFILEKKDGTIRLLDGGMKRKIVQRPLSYFYENMDKIYNYIKESDYSEYSQYQEKISKYIKKIGGSGLIHGSIIDVSFWSHIFVDPFTLEIKFYYAYDISERIVFKNIEELLLNKEKDLYLNFKKQNDLFPVLYNYSIEAQYNFVEKGTEMYSINRKVKKIQYISDGLIRIWLENDTDNLLSNNNKLLSNIKRLENNKMK